MIAAQPIMLGAAALAEAKAYLRVETGDEDALIGRLLGSAAELCEQFTRQTLIAREFQETVAASPVWARLGTAPVSAIIGLEGLPAAGAAFLIAGGQHAIDIDANGEGWVRVTNAGEARRVRVSYRAGMAAEWAGLPDALRHGIVRLAAHLYTHRAAAADEAPPAAVTALWRPFRRMRIG